MATALVQSDNPCSNDSAFIEFEGHTYRHPDLAPHVGSEVEVSTFCNMDDRWVADVYFHTGNTPSGQECINDIVES